MKNGFFRKVLTLLSSLSLVTLFLLYRVGVFDKPPFNEKPTFQPSHNGGSINPSTIDTTNSNKDSSSPLMLSSSKVLILTDKKPTFLDSLKKKATKYKYPKSENEILSSSKSIIILKPQQTNKLNLDSFKFEDDSLKTKKKKEQ